MVCNQLSILKHCLIISSYHFLTLVFTTYFAWPHSFQNGLLNLDYQLPSQLISFDGIHYLTNTYEYEQNYAFLPGFVLLVRSTLFLFPMSTDIAIIVTVIINKGCVYFATGQLMDICRLLGMDSKACRVCGLLFLYNPAAVFYHSLYSESVFVALVFMSIRLQLQLERKPQGPQISRRSVGLLAMAVMVRPTALFLLPAVGLNLLMAFLYNLDSLQYTNAMKYLMQGVTAIIVVIAPYLTYLRWSYEQICWNNLDATQQCSGMKFHQVYSWVQNKYWSVGFMTYLTLKNIVFIAIGTPAIVMMLLAFTKIQEIKHWGLKISWTTLVLVTMLLTNIQSSTRFFSTHPLFYVLIYQRFLKQPIAVVSELCKCWYWGYFAVGFMLYQLGFPWT